MENMESVWPLVFSFAMLAPAAHAVARARGKRYLANAFLVGAHLTRRQCCNFLFGFATCLPLGHHAEHLREDF